VQIEAVIVCNGYADFLEQTLPENLQHLDRVVVVTSPDDKETHALCNKYGVDFLDTDVFYDRGDAFNKGRAINLGLSHCRHKDWLLHLDADILLPHRSRAMLEHAKLNPKNVYGADRLNVVGWEKWQEHRSKVVPQFQYRYLVNPPGEFPIGARLLHNEYGYCPIGYFQLWHSSAHRKYPIHQGSAEHTDVLFSVQWPRERRVLLPELFVFHLESEKAKMGANWQGRKTKRFGPTKEVEAERGNPTANEV
jgi:glycosyltransferase involved in cell wall biosynthesis